MLLGVTKEIKEGELRVSLTPAGVKELVRRGHIVLVEEGAGEGSRFCDREFEAAGAKVTKQSIIFNEAEVITRVKEPLPEETEQLHKGQTLFTFLHLASNKRLTEQLLSKKIIGIAYESVELADGTLPILRPMSAIAGCLAVQVGASCLESIHGGMGILLGGVPAVAPAEVVILGAGNVGFNAARVAAGMGASVTVMGIGEEVERLSYFNAIFRGIKTLIMSPENISATVEKADLLICGVLAKGAKAPQLVTREMIKAMKAGSVIVDVSIDQGGAAETSRPTTHANPTYIIDEVIHYCVTNMPAIVARTSTLALTNVTLPYILQIANQGVEKAIRYNQALAKGVNVFKGQLTSMPVSESLGIPFIPLNEAKEWS